MKKNIPNCLEMPVNGKFKTYYVKKTVYEDGVHLCLSVYDKKRFLFNLTSKTHGVNAVSDNVILLNPRLPADTKRFLEKYGYIYYAAQISQAVKLTLYEVEEGWLNSLPLEDFAYDKGEEDVTIRL